MEVKKLSKQFMRDSMEMNQRMVGVTANTSKIEPPKETLCHKLICMLNVYHFIHSIANFINQTNRSLLPP